MADPHRYFFLKYQNISYSHFLLYFFSTSFTNTVQVFLLRIIYYVTLVKVVSDTKSFCHSRWVFHSLFLTLAQSSQALGLSRLSGGLEGHPHFWPTGYEPQNLSPGQLYVCQSVERDANSQIKRLHRAGSSRGSIAGVSTTGVDRVRSSPACENRRHLVQEFTMQPGLQTPPSQPSPRVWQNNLGSLGLSYNLSNPGDTYRSYSKSPH